MRRRAAFFSTGYSAELRRRGGQRRRLCRRMRDNTAAPQASAAACNAPADLVRLVNPLKRVAQRIAGGQSLTIVAIGSSSTAGAGASSPAMSYPSRLEVELKALWPRVRHHRRQSRRQRRGVPRHAGAVRPRRHLAASRSRAVAGRQQFGAARSSAGRSQYFAARRPQASAGGRHRRGPDQSAIRAQGDQQARRRRHGRSDRTSRRRKATSICSSASP